MKKLICFNNMAATEGFEGEPWEFSPDPEILKEIKSLKQDHRRKRLVTPGFAWNFFSAVRGTISSMRVGDKNPVAGIRAFVVDYDLEADSDAVGKYIDQIPENLRPTYASHSLGNKWHLVWMFEKELPIPSTEFAHRFFNKLSEYLKAERVLAGYDSASIKPTQVWTNGGSWFEVSKNTLDFDVVTGVAVKLIQETNESTEVPLPVIADEVQKRFPGRWKGDFVEGAAGVRFWDAKADNPRGAYICKNGCYCLTGTQPFMKWGDILGHQWVEDQRVVNLGKAASDYYFDGKYYWFQIEPGRWITKGREDTLLHFASRGLSRKQTKAIMSDAEKVLLHVQSLNRVDAAAPILYRPSGLLILNGSKILNISNVRPWEPLARVCEFGEAELVWSILKAHFSTEEALHHYLAWLQVAYRAALNQQPTPGQAMFICGPKSNGKTLFCLRLVAPLLGDKIANPYDYLVKSTRFNSEIFSASLLAINDEEAPHTDKDREAFAQGIKAFVVNPRHMYHPKFCDKIDIEWTGRVYITLNDDPKSVGILPELNSNTEDKMMFLRTVPYQGLWLPRHQMEEQFTKERSIFASALLSYKPPEYVLELGSRSQVRSYHDPVLVGVAKQQDSSFNMFELLKTWQVQGAYWQNSPTPTKWEGTPTDLLTHLSDNQSANTILKDWNVHKVARALTTLGRSGNHGVEFIGEKENRIFRIKKLV